MRFWCDLALDWFWFWHDVAFGLVLVGVVRVSRLMGAALALRLVCLSFWFGFGLVWFGFGLILFDLAEFSSAMVVRWPINICFASRFFEGSTAFGHVRNMKILALSSAVRGRWLIAGNCRVPCSSASPVNAESREEAGGRVQLASSLLRCVCGQGHVSCTLFFIPAP